jgi:M6 family metalloprotease-like protein
MMIKRLYLTSLLLFFVNVAYAVNAPTNLQVVPRYDGAISLVVSWTDASPDETGFEVQRRPVGGAYVTVNNAAANAVEFNDTTATPDQSWEYRVRALNGGTGDSAWVGPSVAMSPTQVWPLNDGSHDILDNYGMPLESVTVGNFYFHKGVDISGSGVQVNAGRGGVVSGISAGAGGQITLRLDYGAGGTYNDPYAHIAVDAVLAVGDVIPTGGRLGTVRDNFFNRATEADHVHWGTRDNLTLFTTLADLDPGGNAPVVGDANNDGQDFIIVDAANNDHTNPRNPAWGDVDFLVDAYDEMSNGNTLEQGLFNIGYWIQAGPPEGENVRSAADPYKLIEFSSTGYTPGGPAPTGVVESAVIYWDLEADLQGVDTWKSFFTWIITNTKGNDGSGANVDATQFWRTDARKATGTEANGSDASRARENQEARFPDGKYFVHILPSDHVQTSDYVRTVDVDNSRPYVKRVTVYSGLRIVYQAQWVWDGTTAQLALQPATFDAAAPFTALRTQDITVEVEFSEPMQSASITALSPLGVIPNLVSTQPDHARTIWRGLISNLDIADDGSDDGTHMLTIDGRDLAGNALLQINNRNSMGADHHNRDAAGVMRGTVGTDTIHGFKIEPLSGVIPITAIFMKQTAADPATTPAAKALALQTALNNYFDEVSYAEISFAVTGHGWYQLDNPIDWYYTHPQSPLLDLVQEAITDAQSNGVDLTNTNYVLAVTDENTARDEWSTNGAWPYTVSAAPGWKLMAGGALNLASTDPHVTNLTGRMIGLMDLFAYPDVTVARPFVGPWSHMSDKDHNVHVMGWEKWRVGWLDETGTATGKTLTRVNKPPVATPIVNQTFTLSPIDDNSNTGKMVVIEIGDRLHYTAEYRRQQNLDTDLPDAGIVIVKANDYINQGEGTAIVQESPTTAGDLSDATFNTTAPRNVFDDVGSGVNIEVTSMNANQAEIRLNYAVPATENDVYVSPHDDRWKAEDIWIDAPDLEGNFEADPLTVKDANERPVVGEVNKVYGRIRNQGHADATNFESFLEIREPWGAGGPWRSLKVETVPLLQGQDTNPGAYHIVSADWIPVGDIHSCVKLSAEGVANDINVENNRTQENISDFTTTTGSPYGPVTSRFSVENPYNQEIIVVFKLDGLPPSWSYIMTPERLVIPAKGVGDAQVTIQPHSSSPVCTREEITINAYTPRVDTLKQLGGITLNVGLKNPLEVTGNSRLQCNRLDDKYQKQLTHAPSVTGATACAIITEGCTDPGIPNAQVAVVYTAPDGSKQVRYVTTDANGCYVDVLPVAGAGLWQTQVVVEETDCREEAKTPKTPIVVGPVFPCSGPWWCCVLYVVFIIAVVILVLRLLMLLTGASYERMKATLLGALAATLLLAFLLIRYCHVDICWILLAIVIAIVLALMILFYRKRLSKQ